MCLIYPSPYKYLVCFNHFSSLLYCFSFSFVSYFILTLSDRSRINTDRFPKQVQRRKLLGGSAACSPFGNFLVLNSLKSWVSESLRKDIGTISTWKVLFLVKYIISFFKNLTDFRWKLVWIQACLYLFNCCFSVPLHFVLHRFAFSCFCSLVSFHQLWKS